jgi:hypothetical protein
VADASSKSAIRFLPAELDFFPRVGEGWTKTGRIVLFEMDNYGKLSLKVLVGPAPAEIRDRICDFVSEHSKVLNRAKTKVYKKYWTFHLTEWVKSKPYADLSFDDLRGEIKSRFDRFMVKELPELVDVLGEMRKLPEIAEYKPAGGGEAPD